jgi:hypothetical protein
MSRSTPVARRPRLGPDVEHDDLRVLELGPTRPLAPGPLEDHDVVVVREHTVDPASKGSPGELVERVDRCEQLQLAPRDPPRARAGGVRDDVVGEASVDDGRVVPRASPVENRGRARGSVASILTSW